MKKILFISFITAGVFALTACNPVEESVSNDQKAITAEELRNASSVTVYQEDGQNINYVHVTTSVSTPVQWYNGVQTANTPTTDMLQLVTGDQAITVIAMNPDGSLVSVEYPIHVDKISDNHPVDPHWGMLCGSGTKDWIWDADAGNVWGNTGYLSTNDGKNLGGWWGVPPADVAGQVTNYGYSLDDSGADATMTFQLAGTKIIKSSGGTGTFSFDFTEAAYVDTDGNKGDKADATKLWAVGQLKTTGDGVLFPVQINTGTLVSTLNVNYIDDNNMVLTYASDGTSGWGEATYWKFKAKE